MKRLRAIIAAAFVVALAWPASAAAAAAPSWDLTGTYTVVYTCTSGCTETWTHSMTITSSNHDTGAVAGTGYVEGYPGYDYTLTGTVSGSNVTLNIEWAPSSGLQTSNPLVLTGSVDPSGGMSGTASDEWDRTFTWETTAGAATPIDRTPPTATLTAPASPTSAATLTYDLAFNEAVSGLTASDFTRTGTATGCAVGAPSGSGKAYTVAVTGCSDGTVILALKADSVADAEGNPGPTANVVAGTVTIDRGAITATLAPAATATSAPTVTYTVTFSKAVTGLAASDFTRTGTASGCSVGAPSGSGSSYTVAVTGCSEGTVVLTLKANSVADAASNTGPAADVAASTVTIDRTVPSTAALAVVPRVNSSLSGSAIPLTLTWSASDNAGGSGLARYELARSTNGGAWTTVSASLTTKSASTTAASSGTVRYRVRAVDKAGNTGAWANGLTLSPSLVQQTSTAVRYSGIWTTSTSSSYSGGSAKYAKIAGRSVSYAFTGRSIALVTTKSSARGKVRVYVNNSYVATVDLYRSSTQYRAVAWQKTWSTSGTRTVKLVVVGTSGRPRVDLDAFVVVK